MNITTRPTLAALGVAAIVFAAPGTAVAGDGGSKPMTAGESFALTCGHLGVPCNAAPHRRHTHRARHARHRRHD
jgi:hypothetical protein